MKLSIVFLNYNRLKETRYTVEQLRLQIQDRQDIEIIAIDNNSHDGTAAYLAAQTDIIALCLHDNTGIAGYNQGFEQAKGEYILVLDDDSHPKNAACIDNAISYLDQHTAVAAIACQIETRGQIVRSWHIPTTDKIQASLAFIGCGFFIRRAVFKAVGWYPADFFLYQNEIEVAIQLQRKNLAIHYLPACRIIHRESPQSRPNWRRVFYPTRNTIWLLRRYLPQPYNYYFIFSRLCFGFMRCVQAGEYKVYIRAVKQAFSQSIRYQALSVEQQQALKLLWQENSIWHQLKKRLSG